MNKKVLLLHGWGGSNFPHWQSWLAGEIAKNYGTVSFLQFSDYDFPKLDVWKRELKSALREFQPDIVICHSLANTLWLHSVNEIEAIKKLYLVAPPSFTCEIEELKEFFPLVVPNTTASDETLLVCSTNDPYMSIEEANKIQKILNVPMQIIENGGHINTDSGFGEWPWMLQEIMKDLNS
jgi:predicted alpha/beta hydrolase family esterase